ncbi:MAG: carbohydrate porin, partial [Alphaproteobacteria bacterium]|nr:carbohydrate porin [Alphaproteobacteria bacterium]
GLFVRVSATYNSPEEINQTYVIGGVMNNPLNRNQLDQIGLATSINKVNKEVVGDDTRDYETVLEAYWAWGIGNWLTITPDLQFYIHPALDKNEDTATVASIRTTFMF